MAGRVHKLHDLRRCGMSSFGSLFIRDACKKKIAHILSFRDRGWGGGRPKLNCLENPENERFFYYFKGKNRSFLEVFETKGGGEGGSFAVVSKRQNMSDFYFASIPYVDGSLVSYRDTMC